MNISNIGHNVNHANDRINKPLINDLKNLDIKEMNLVKSDDVMLMIRYKILNLIIALEKNGLDTSSAKEALQQLQIGRK